MGADKVLVIGLKCAPESEQLPTRAASSRAITHPAFVLGKMLNVLILDQIEHELRRLDTLNGILDAASEALGAGCLDAINRVTRDKRGLQYRKVDTTVVRPSRDIGAIAAESYHRTGLRGGSRGMLPRLLARSALHGVPEEEADLFSYLYFDAAFTQPLIELGREDARRQHDEILALLSV
jgi:NTE family protein